MKWVKFKLGVKLTPLKWELFELGTKFVMKWIQKISISLIIDELWIGFWL